MQGLQKRIYFQQDGHNARDYLNLKFGEQWLGTYGPIAWPPRSPNLSPFDFFLWGHLQSIVDAVPIQNMEHLKQRIRTACKQVLTIVRATNTNLLRGAEVCLQQSGFQFEQFLLWIFHEIVSVQLLKVPELNVISSFNNKHKLLSPIQADCYFLLKFSLLCLQDHPKWIRLDKSNNTKGVF